ncbi:MAG: phosphatidate phosphatase App1 family protein, partial [Pirellulaceae bacterium]
KGMKEVFEAWQQKAVKFHYVSASPWQIYNELHPFLDHTGFPGGSFHLRQFTLKGQVIRKLIRRRYQKKRNQIESLLQRFPRRQFVLIGDSGEHDSDIYGSLARQYGEQVRKIWIRSLAGNPLDLTRSLEAFRDVPKTTWRIFHEASELSL